MSKAREHCWHSNGYSHAMGYRMEWGEVCCHCGTRRSGATVPGAGCGPWAPPLYVAQYVGGDEPCEPKPKPELKEGDMVGALTIGGTLVAKWDESLGLFGLTAVADYEIEGDTIRFEIAD